MIEFDVFGRRIGVRRSTDVRRVWEPARDGKRRPANDVRIPPWVRDDGLDAFLFDHVHESATPEHPHVSRRSPPGAP